MEPTPYKGLNAVLRQMTDGIQGVLGDVFVGAYLQGSFAAGDFDEHSDVDFVIAVSREMSDMEVGALQGVHGRVYDIDCEWSKHLEGSYFAVDVLRSCDGRGKDLWYLNHGDRALVLSKHCNTAVVRWILREHGVTLAGPAPSTLVDPVPVEVLRDHVGQVMTVDHHASRDRCGTGMILAVARGRRFEQPCEMIVEQGNSVDRKKRLGNSQGQRPQSVPESGSQ